MDLFTFSLTIIIIGISLVIYGLLKKSKKSENTLEDHKIDESKNQNSQNTKLQSEIKPKQNFLHEILILFGSQSGTAAKFSNTLAQEGENNLFGVKVIDLEEYENYKLNENICIFLMATYGEGEPTDNAKLFYKWLTANKDENNLLKGLKFSVFGLGNTQYQFYNQMGRNIDKLLEKMGGDRIYKYGEGDDNSSLEDDFNAWKENLWNELKEKLHTSKEKESEIKLEKKLSLEIQKNNKIGLFCEYSNEEEINLKNYNYKNDSIEYEFQTKSYLDSFEAEIYNIKELRQNNDDGSTLHLEINIKNTPIKYLTAQNLAIYPENQNELVEELANYLNLDLNKIIKLKYYEDGISKRKFKYPFPSPLTIRTILTKFCDFQGPIMKKTLKDLALIIENNEIKKRFEFLSSNDGKNEFKSEIELKKINIFLLLKQYQIKLTLEQFISLVPRINPRYFTISSSNLKHPEIVHVTASILEERLQDGTIKKGLASQYFSKIKEKFINGEIKKVLVSFKESNFVLPQNKNIPIMMIGPGCGVAPFRAFLQEKEYLREKELINETEMEMTLYFGSKHKNGDNLFQNEMDEFLKNKILQNYFCAFSRDQPEKIYVQHLLKKNSDEIYDFIKKKNGLIFICGATQMGKDVIEVLENIWMEKELFKKEEAQAFIKNLEVNKQLIKELWG